MVSTMGKVTQLRRGSELGSKLRPSDSNSEWLEQEIGRTAAPGLLLCTGPSSDKELSREEEPRTKKMSRMCRTGNSMTGVFPTLWCRQHQKPSRRAGGTREPGFQEPPSHCARLCAGQPKPLFPRISPSRQ